MQLTFLRGTLLASIVAFLVLASCAVDPSSANPMLVEVWRGGDDGLTLRFTDALNRAFGSLPEFILSSGKKRGTLVVTIPTNVGWKQIGTRTRVLYKIEFASVDGKNLGASTGSCWDDTLAECAAHVVIDAKNAARKIH